MTKKEKAAFVIKTLDKLFPEPDIPLIHKDPFTLLISVLLSAQSTDKRVNQVTPALFSLADNPKDMAKLGITAIEKIIRPCGLSNNKSRAIASLSQIITEKYHGEVPQTLEELEMLPGVGHKTASVLIIQAFGGKAFPVDTHIHRLMYRWGLSSGKHVIQTEKDAKRLFPESTWPLLHLRLISFGRTYCPARGHHPEQCPICSKIGIKKRM